ncbi:MAG TPA: GNAT family N-acetyltransferase [Bacteroidia bacterium]|jgi:RimJ/RimL family protein N-acetyltransferase
MIILETERLRLREFTLHDSPFIIELVNSPGWLEFIGDRNIRTREQAEEYLLNGPIKSYSGHGFGLSMVELKASSEPVGMCGILKRPDLNHPDIGFAFLPQFSGKGYAFEIGEATIRHAASVLKLKEILAITVPHNLRSVKLLEKIGMKLLKPYKSKDTDLLLFSNKTR